MPPGEPVQEPGCGDPREFSSGEPRSGHSSTQCHPAGSAPGLRLCEPCPRGRAAPRIQIGPDYSLLSKIVPLVAPFRQCIPVCLANAGKTCTVACRTVVKPEPQRTRSIKKTYGARCFSFVILRVLRGSGRLRPSTLPLHGRSRPIVPIMKRFNHLGDATECRSN